MAPQPAQSGPVLTAVKTKPPAAVAGAALRPVLTAAARGALLNPGRDEETVLRSNKETEPWPPRRPRPSSLGKRDRNDCRGVRACPDVVSAPPR